jgi:hypothetical protein
VNRKALREFVIRWEMTVWYAAALFGLGSLVAVIWVFPDVSNLWVSIFVLVTGFFSTIGSMIAAIKAREPA